MSEWSLGVKMKDVLWESEWSKEGDGKTKSGMDGGVRAYQSEWIFVVNFGCDEV